jgi:ribose/xylose/arabinose/galactoside ABC-type transport system permease subunit
MTFTSGIRRYSAVLGMLAALFAGLCLTQDQFATSENLENLLTGVSILFVVAIGMTFVVIAGGIDLSVGAIVAIGGFLLASLLELGIPAGITIALCVLGGALIGGVVNGLAIGVMRLSFFIVTLASMIALTGAVNLWSDGKSRYVISPAVEFIGVGTILGVATPIWIMAATLAVAFVVERRTYFGRDVFATGGSLAAARISGVRTARTVVAVYAISGAAAGLASVIEVGRIGAAAPQVGGELPLQAVAAILLGGTSLMGGAGGVTGTAVGVLFIGTLQNGLSIAGLSSFWQMVVTGVILVVAAVADRLRESGVSPLALARRQLGQTGDGARAAGSAS